MTPVFSKTDGMMVRFGGRSGGLDDAAAMVLPVPCLRGDEVETILCGGQFCGEISGFQFYRAGALMAGFRIEPRAGDLANQSQGFYQRLLDATRGQHLYRIWNYIADINGEVNGLENYRAFCLGRSRAFENTFGLDYKQAVPSASAVGMAEDYLAVGFVAGVNPAQHFENPAQVPAYDYPREHGPKAPAFARATAVGVDGKTLIFISGTASIKGHVTIAAGSLAEQIDCTLDNLRLISKATGLGHELGENMPFARYFKIYLRNAKDVDQVEARLKQGLIKPSDKVTYLHSDICRSALDVEIEVTLRSTAEPATE